MGPEEGHADGLRTDRGHVSLDVSGTGGSEVDLDRRGPGRESKVLPEPESLVPRGGPLEPGASPHLNTEPFFLEDLIDTGEQVRPSSAQMH